MMKLYFRLIQFSLGLYEGKEFLDGTALKDFDWKAFFDFVKKQTLVGIAMDGVQKLPKGVAPDANLLLVWFGLSHKLMMRNSILNKATVYVYKKIREAGYPCCILKGQGNAMLYPHPVSRTPGDVDVWVDASREEIRSLACSLAKDKGYVSDESLNHVGLFIKDIAVELHSTPAIMANFFYNRRLQKWLNEEKGKQCSHLVSLGSRPVSSGGDAQKGQAEMKVAVPTASFNAVYQLYHLYHHYFYEGVGLRQVLDYYFVVTGLMDELAKLQTGSAISDSENYSSLTEIQQTLKQLGLWNFAGAMMYVLREVLGLSEDKMLVPVDIRRGEMLLHEILAGGNFGRYDSRNGLGNGFIGHNLQRLCRDFRFLRYYPAEALSEPLFRIWHYGWRHFLPKRTSEMRNEK